jgi:tripartite-type tricarboxylate transporter receptor subunit TctC
VRVVVPYPAGGPTDVMARLVAQKLSEALGHQFYIENLPGASGTIGTAAVANAPADGRTILFATPDFLLQPIVRAKAPYDAVKNFAPLVLAASAAEVIAVNPSVPAKNLQDLVAVLKANPGKPMRCSRAGCSDSASPFSRRIASNISRSSAPARAQISSSST